MGQPVTNPVPAPTPPPAPATPPPAPAPAATPPAPPAPIFSQADLDRIIGERLAKKDAELKDAQAKAAQWEAFENAAKPAAEQELAAAVKAAEEAATAKTRAEYGGQLVEAHVIAAAAGRLSDAQRAALLLGLDRGRFLKPDGGVDEAGIKTLVDGLAPATPATPTPTPTPVPGGFGQGAHPGAPTGGLAAGAAEYDRLHAAKASPFTT